MGILRVLLLAGLLATSFLVHAETVGTAFSYQGELQQSGTPANGTFDFQFDLYDAFIEGIPVATTVQLDDVLVVDGVFSVALDFGLEAFNGDQLWLEVAVRDGLTDGVYTVLSPRQTIAPAPYALFALSGNAGPQGPQGEQGPPGPAIDAIYLSPLLTAGDGEVIGTYYSGRVLTHEHYWVSIWLEEGLITTLWTFYPEANCQGQPYQIIDKYNSNGNVFRTFSETNGYETSYIHRTAESVTVTVLSAMEVAYKGGGACKSRHSTQDFFPVLPNDPAITGVPNNRGTLESPYPQPLSLLGGS